jgi:transposase
MMNKDLPPELERERLNELPKEELVEMIIQQVIVNRELLSSIQELKQEIEKLCVIADLDSKTSSKPPSTDLLKKSEKNKPETESFAPRPKRAPAGQPGHKGKTRKGFDRVARYEILRPQRCCCGQAEFILEPVKVEFQQVAQLAQRPIEIVEYHRHTLSCQHCERLQSADWSPEILPGQDLGVRLQAFLGWMSNYAHLPYGKQQEMLWEMGEIDIGVGTLVRTNERIEQAIEPSIVELRDWVQQEQPNIHVDETPWPVKGLKESLWVIANPQFCLFTAADTRSRAELETILVTEYTGVLSSDDFSVYNGYQAFAQQKCLAHLRRHFKKLIQLPGFHNKAIGEAFVDLIDEAFKNYA